MTCREVLNRAALYLSGELNGEEYQRLARHLEMCPECEEEIELQALTDARLTRTLGREFPDASRIEQNIRKQVSGIRSRRRWLTAGALAAALIAASYGLFRPAPAPHLYQAAARDHRTEVIEGQPRPWRSGVDDIGVLAHQNGLSFAQVAALAPAGYSLERAKICRLDGRRMLHLVFRDGRQSYSVFLAPQRGVKDRVRTIRANAENIAGFENGRFAVLVVTSEKAADCAGLAQFAAARL